MKNLLITILIVGIAHISMAQKTGKDSARVYADSLKFKRDDNGLSITFGKKDTNYTSNEADKKKDHDKARAYFGITFSRFDLGFATLIDNGSFTLSPQNEFLSYRQIKTSNVGFDVVQFGVKFSKTFRIYLSGGFDWTLIRLRDNITILPNQPVLTYRTDNIDYSKNRFSSSYLRIPLSFEFRSKMDSRGNRFHFVIGPDGGFLLDGMVKQISAEHGKQKVSDTYHFATFRYGGFTRIGYGDFGLFAKYYTNDMFENSPAQAGLKNLSFGLTVGF